MCSTWEVSSELVTGISSSAAVGETVVRYAVEPRSSHGRHGGRERRGYLPCHRLRAVARGLPTDGPFDEDTGLGFVLQRSGHYSDALARGKKVIALVAEVFGGLSPHPARFLRQLSRVAAKHTTRDSTKYTRCARSFRQYHGQRISHAIVMTDALNIHEGILKLKKAVLQRRAA